MHFDTEGFYSWTASDDDGRGSCGITGELERASVRLRQALESLAPGATGAVQFVRLDRYASDPSYIYGVTLLRLHREKAIAAAE
ncbi:hypothetical protein [Nonomuraea gerenzanensis]|uniref:Uncharacterized protein n=1 Tax=Nonomuraea gerenzanensis TaxID=93944 RepID=A0A1M4DX35_9ACTN|nr:hypothetical protein [Nonomuraea gerenzanensis]UBU13482.1 hypothetical protein LCN96_00125 [Nonomuraea gerenzanensis]SBO91145.1 hypothetical protein BN4615_P659 [Nonomuraea gerenzanensis]